MDKLMKEYLKRAAEIIGERSPGEVMYDDAVVAALNQGRPIQEALAIAGAKYPSEALGWDPTTIHDIAAHYDYLREHLAITERIRGRKESSS